MAIQPVGGDETDVRSAIGTNQVNLWATKVSHAGSGNQWVSPKTVRVLGQAVTITIPDMDPESPGNNGIAKDSLVVIRFDTFAGIGRPKQAGNYNLTVALGANAIAVTSRDYSITETYWK